jgi:hypothetical protein
LHRVAKAGDLISKARQKVSAKAVAQELVLRQEGYVAVLLLPDYPIDGVLVIAELASLVDNEAFGGLWHRTPSIEDLGHRIPRQPAGIRNILHGYSFQRHKYPSPKTRANALTNLSHGRFTERKPPEFLDVYMPNR